MRPVSRGRGGLAMKAMDNASKNAGEMLEDPYAEHEQPGPSGQDHAARLRRSFRAARPIQLDLSGAILDMTIWKHSNVGTVVQVIGSGPRRGVQPAEELPEIYNALQVDQHDERKLSTEQIDVVVRGSAAHRPREPACVRLRWSLDGRDHVRGMDVRSIPVSPSRFPSGASSTRAESSTCSAEPVDEQGPVGGRRRGRRAAGRSTGQRREFDRTSSTKTRDLRDGHQGHRPARPLREAVGRTGLFGGAGVGKTVIIHGAHQQHRDGAWRLRSVFCGCR